MCCVSEKQKQLMEFAVQDLVKILVERQQLSFKEGLGVVYQSELFQKLQDAETGLYLESPLYLYDMLKDELQYGRLVQNEI